MAGSFVAVSDDVSAIQWNPAGVKKITKISVSLMHTNLFVAKDLTKAPIAVYDFVGFVIPVINHWSIGLSALNLYAGGYIPRDEKNNLDNIVKGNNNLSFTITNSFSIGKNMFFGLNLKYISETFSNETFTGYGADIGCLVSIWDIVSFGLNVQNIVKPTVGIQTWGTNYKTGLALSLLKKSLIFGLQADIIELSKTADIKFGVEYSVGKKSKLFIRTGWDLTNQYPVLGLGSATDSLGIDYAVTLHPDMGFGHRVSLNLAIKKTDPKEKMILKDKKKVIEKGDKKLKEPHKKLLKK